MPPLAKNLIDTDAMSVIAAWITSLPVTNLPPLWIHGDIGAVGVSGDASYVGGQYKCLSVGFG